MSPAPAKNWLEWLVFGLGLVVTVGVVGYLAVDAATGGPRHPKLEVRLGAPDAVPGGWRVPVTVENAGEGSAEQVTVEVTLDDAAGRVRVELPLSRVPRESVREGAVVLPRDPRGGGRLTGRVTGFELP